MWIHEIDPFLIYYNIIRVIVVFNIFIKIFLSCKLASFTIYKDSKEQQQLIFYLLCINKYGSSYMIASELLRLWHFNNLLYIHLDL